MLFTTTPTNFVNHSITILPTVFICNYFGQPKICPKSGRWGEAKALYPHIARSSLRRSTPIWSSCAPMVKHHWSRSNRNILGVRSNQNSVDIEINFGCRPNPSILAESFLWRGIQWNLSRLLSCGSFPVGYLNQILA